VPIDHVIYATGDLDRASERIHAELGLESVEGGRHFGHGTHNRIVPLGGGYLELMAIADREEAAGSPIGGALAARLEARGDGLFGWAIATDDIEAVAARIGTPVSTIEREGLTARLAGVAEALREPFLPFFIRRDRGIADPGAAGDAGGITRVDVACEPDRLSGWVGDIEVPVRLVEGEPGLVAVGIGERELRAP